MGNSEIFESLKEYLLLGIIAVLLAAIIFGVGYFFIYKRIYKGKKNVSKKTLIVGAVFVCYLVVLIGATLLGRFGGWVDPKYVSVFRRFQLFSSYREAWNDFSYIEWRNLILNIFIFVPMGFLLPVLSNKFSKYWKTYLMGLCVTVLIEFLQLITYRGVFEADDILNNLMGTMIGYGVYKIVAYVIDKIIKKSETKAYQVILAQIPLMITVIAFISIFVVYSNQEYGNLPSNYNTKVSMKDVIVKSDVKVSEEKTEQKVYKYKRLTHNEAVEEAKRFFENIGCKMDDSQTTFYDETAVCYSDSGESVWIDYAGGTLQYTDFSQTFDENDDGIKREQNAKAEDVKRALAELGIEVPERATFSKTENGAYTFLANQIVNGDVMYDGHLVCDYNMNHKIASVQNNIVAYTLYKKAELRSEKDAFEDMKEGKFKVFLNGGQLGTIQVKDVSIGYEMDTKEFYQPVYEFCVIIDGLEDTIVIPAMDK